MPESVRDLESPELVFEEDDEELEFQREDVRRSPGLMLEDGGRAVQDARRAVGSRPGKFAKLTAGAYIAYALTTSTKSRKLCSVGKILSVSARENTVMVHKYGPVSDGHLRLHWQPLYWEDGVLVFGSGSRPAEETVEIKRVLEPLQLHDGVISHAAARKLENRGFTFEDQVAAYRPESVEAVQEEELLAGMVRKLQELSLIHI